MTKNETKTKEKQTDLNARACWLFLCGDIKMFFFNFLRKKPNFDERLTTTNRLFWG